MACFHVFRLTEREKKGRQFLKNVLTIEKEFEKTLDLEKAKRYHIPTGSKVREYHLSTLITFLLE